MNGKEKDAKTSPASAEADSGPHQAGDSRARPGLRGWAALVLSGAATVAIHIHLAHLPAGAGHVSTVLLAYGVAFLLYLVGASAARRLRASAPAVVVLWIFLVAAASMAPYLRSTFSLSSDVQRYRWDGFVAEAGYDPYRVAPGDAELDSLRAVFGREVSYPESPAAYPPLAELLFYGMARTRFSSVFHYRVLLAGAAILAGLVLLVLLRAMGGPAVHVAWFLWHPLLILESAGNARLETLALLLLLVSLTLLATRHHLTPGATLALAGLTKPFSLVTLPLYLRRVPPYRLLSFLLVAAAGVVPFVGAGPALVRGMTDYVLHARFNPGLYALLERFLDFFGEGQWARPAAAFSGLGLAFGLFLTDDGSKASLVRRAFYLVLTPLALGPVLPPASLLWVLPFFALVSWKSAWYGPTLLLSATIMLSHAAALWGHLPAWVSWLEFGPVGILLAWELSRAWRTRARS